MNLNVKQMKKVQSQADKYNAELTVEHHRSTEVSRNTVKHKYVTVNCWRRWKYAEVWWSKSNISMVHAGAATILIIFD